jgi:hypothetical protein
MYKVSKTMGWFVGVLFLLSEISVAGVNYYVSPTGSDSYNGTSLSTPFKTIQKAASVMVAGDNCFIRQGTYRETVTPVNSGSAGSPITFAAYQGEKVIVSGADTVLGWTVHSGQYL